MPFSVKQFASQANLNYISPIISFTGSIVGIWNMQDAIKQLRQKEIKHSAISFVKGICKLGTLALVTYAVSRLLFKNVINNVELPKNIDLKREIPKDIDPNREFINVIRKFCIVAADAEFDPDLDQKISHEGIFKGCFDGYLSLCSTKSDELCESFKKNACNNVNRFFDLCHFLKDNSASGCAQYAQLKDHCSL